MTRFIVLVGVAVVAWVLVGRMSVTVGQIEARRDARIALETK